MDVLLVNSDPDESALIASILETEGCVVEIVSSAREALEKIKVGFTTLILSEFDLPDKTGIEFVRSAKKVHPAVLVMIVLAHKDLNLVPETLNAGAVGFLVKPFTNYELRKQVEQIRILSANRRGRELALLNLIEEKHEMTFETGTLMEADNFVITTTYLTEQFVLGGSHVPNDKRMKFGLAIHEALRNSIEHGNLELSSFLKVDSIENDLGDSYDKLLKQRSREPGYANRKIRIRVERDADRASIIIKDDGEGFDIKKVLKREKSGELNPLELSGRGLLLIESYMDEVIYSKKGNEITLIRYLQ